MHIKGLLLCSKGIREGPGSIPRVETLGNVSINLSLTGPRCKMVPVNVKVPLVPNHFKVMAYTKVGSVACCMSIESTFFVFLLN